MGVWPHIICIGTDNTLQIPRKIARNKTRILVGKDKPTVNLMFQHNKASQHSDQKPWAWQDQFHFYSKKVKTESPACVLKKHVFSAQQICIEAVCVCFLKPLHGSLANKNTGKYANVGCPKDNATDMQSMVTVIQFFA